MAVLNYALYWVLCSSAFALRLPPTLKEGWGNFTSFDAYFLNTATDSDQYVLHLVGGEQQSLTQKHAVVTHVCSDDWMPGALALAASLRAAGTHSDLVLMISEGVSHELERLAGLNFDKVLREQPILPHLSITRAQGDCVTLKFRCWQLPYEKVLYMDSDMIALRSVDHILKQHEELSANKDPNLDQFDSGMMVLKPLEATFSMLHKTIVTARPAGNRQGDQAFLNKVFPNCKSSRSSFGIGCWGGVFGVGENKFTRDLSNDEVKAISEGHGSYNTLHCSGDWGGNSKPWMEGCRKKSDSMGRNGMQDSLLKIWNQAFHSLKVTKQVPLPQLKCK